MVIVSGGAGGTSAGERGTAGGTGTTGAGTLPEGKGKESCDKKAGFSRSTDTICSFPDLKIRNVLGPRSTTGKGPT